MGFLPDGAQGDREDRDGADQESRPGGPGRIPGQGGLGDFFERDPIHLTVPEMPSRISYRPARNISAVSGETPELNGIMSSGIPMNIFRKENI